MHCGQKLGKWDEKKVAEEQEETEVREVGQVTVKVVKFLSLFLGLCTEMEFLNKIF